jgi:hypothetical protein
MSDKCTIPKCKNLGTLIYLGKNLCDKCWEKYSTKSPDVLKKILGIKEKSS